jgi:hypothetical protein
MFQLIKLEVRPLSGNKTTTFQKDFLDNKDSLRKKDEKILNLQQAKVHGMFVLFV